MNFMILLLLVFAIITDAAHFNGGTISWAPINPYDNSSTVNITITQSYSWSYPTVTCTTNVPISTATYSSTNANLACVSDCTTDGGYSTAPVNILTDCVSYSASLGMMSSTRSVNITLNASAYFYVSYTGSAWRQINDPPESGLSWSILCFIDLRMRDDGIINTPPVATVVSPQYVIVNTTNQIEIPVSDVNAGDDVRCRWSIYRSGYRRRREIDEDIPLVSEFDNETNPDLAADGDVAHIREKRQAGCSSCNGNTCWNTCRCSCPGCSDTTCSGTYCSTSPYCPAVTTTTRTTLSTSSFLHPPIDECGGICASTGGLPNGTTLSNCTLSFTGLIPDTWYAISLQVEDFINDTSLVPMSSVPVQFLIYVLPTPTCSVLPLVLPLTSCLEVETGVTINITLYAVNLCDSTVSITDIIVAKGITGMVAGNLLTSTTNSSLVYVTYTWTPQTNQIGSQELCTIAFNSLFVQSAQYCVTFTVTASTPNCTVTTVTSLAVTQTSTTKPSTPINIPLIVGLSLLGLLLALSFCCCCLLYHLCWSAAARRRRQNPHNDGTQRQKYLLLNPLLIARKFPFKAPHKSYVIHNISDNRDSTYTNQSGRQTVPLPSAKSRMSPVIINNSKMFDTERISNRHQSFTEDNAQPQSTDRQSNISLPFYSVIRPSEALKSAAKGQDDNTNSEIQSTNVHVIKLPRNKKSAVRHNSQSDDNRSRKSIDTNTIVDNYETVNDSHVKGDTTPTIRKTKIIKIQSAAFQNRRRSGPLDENINSQGLTEEYEPRMRRVSVTKLKRVPDKIQASNEHTTSTFPENNGKMTSNGVTVVTVPRKKSKTRSRSSGYRKSVVDVMEMS